jgi:hypothetical protein
MDHRAREMSKDSTGGSVEDSLRAELAAARSETSTLRGALALLYAEFTAQGTQKARLAARILTLENKQQSGPRTKYVSPRYRFEARGVRAVRDSLELARAEVQRMMNWDTCVLRALGTSGREWSCHEESDDVPVNEAPRIVRLPDGAS